MLLSNKIFLIFIGKNKDKYIGDGLCALARNLNKYVKINYEFCKESHLKLPEERMAKEADDIRRTLARIKADQVILLTEKDETLNTRKFSQRLGNWLDHRSSIVFVTGGAYGLHSSLLKEYNDHLSLSPMTFSHQMVRLIFLEQLYRGISIHVGSDYHHD